MSFITLSTQPKSCDICEYVEHKDQPSQARFDCKSRDGRWANICTEHFNYWSINSLGLGLGQVLIYNEDERGVAEMIVEDILASGMFSGKF